MTRRVGVWAGGEGREVSFSSAQAVAALQWVGDEGGVGGDCGVGVGLGLRLRLGVAAGVTVSQR